MSRLGLFLLVWVIFAPVLIVCRNNSGHLWEHLTFFCVWITVTLLACWLLAQGRW